MMEGIAQVEHVINFTTSLSHIFHTCEIFHLIFREINATQNMHGGQSEPTTIVTGYVCSRDPVNFTLNIILKRYEFKGNSSSPPPPALLSSSSGLGEKKRVFQNCRTEIVEHEHEPPIKNKC